MAPHQIMLSTVFAGQSVGVKQVDDKIVEEERPLLCQLEAAHLLADGPGEGALLVRRCD